MKQQFSENSAPGATGAARLEPALETYEAEPAAEEQVAAHEDARLTGVIKRDVQRRLAAIVALPFVAILFLESFRKLLGQPDFISLCTNPIFLLITLAGVGVAVPVWTLRPTRNARAAQEALAKHQGLPAIGGLIESLYFNELKEGPPIEALLGLLSNLTAADAHLLSERHHHVLRSRLLSTPQGSGNLAVSLEKRKALHARMQIAILKAFETTGDVRDLAAVSTLIKRSVPQAVLEAATVCAHKMHLRLDDQMASDVLLRSSSNPEGAEDLLRASGSTPDSSPEELLRASSD